MESQSGLPGIFSFSYFSAIIHHRACILNCCFFFKTILAAKFVVNPMPSRSRSQLWSHSPWFPAFCCLVTAQWPHHAPLMIHAQFSLTLPDPHPMWVDSRSPKPWLHMQVIVEIFTHWYTSPGQGEIKKKKKRNKQQKWKYWLLELLTDLVCREFQLRKFCNIGVWEQRNRCRYTFFVG